MTTFLIVLHVIACVFLIAVILLTILLVLFFADYLASVLLRPIHELERGAKMIGSGALHHRIRVDGHQHDELGRLASSFNQMGESLQTSEKKVRAYSRSLETAREELDALVDGIATDLKKSLRTVEAFASFLQEDYDVALGEDGQRGSGDHDDDAVHCKKCGSALEPVAQAGADSGEGGNEA